MRSDTLRSALALAAIAIVEAQPLSKDCCFSLSAHGIAGAGPVSQLSDGQNRVGQLPDGQNRVDTGVDKLAPGQYCLKNGVITDSQQRGCIITPETSQFQCDAGVPGTPGFSVNAQSELVYQGADHFTACPVNANGQYNLYIQGVSNQCITGVTLVTSGDCVAPASSAPPATTAAPSTIVTTVSASHPPPPPVTSTVTANLSIALSSTAAPSPSAPASCPTDLKGSYIAPYAITVVDKHDAGYNYGSSFFPDIDQSNNTIFSFGVPPSLDGKTCSLVFLWPKREHLQTSDFTTSGEGDLVFYYKNKVVGTVTDAEPGENSVVRTVPCKAGSYDVTVAATQDLALRFFQDYNPEPIGLYVTTC